MTNRSMMYVGSKTQTDNQGVPIKNSGRSRKVAANSGVTVVGGSMSAARTLAADPQFGGANSSNDDLKLKRRLRGEMLLATVLIVVAAVLFWLGRNYYDERYYIPEEGLGYYLGMVGGILMLLAYGYSLFKYMSAIRSRAVMKYWLTMHIIFGVVGPLLIMFHSTFQIGSINGGIALIATGLVFISGVMARFIYAISRFGLGDQKDRVKELQDMLILAGHKIQSRRLEKFTETVLGHRESLLHAIWEMLTFGWRSRWLYISLSENMRAQSGKMARIEGWDADTLHARRTEFKAQLRAYISMLKRVSTSSVYERFFAFCRNAHVPLLYLLLMSGIVHVVAVHMY